MGLSDEGDENTEQRYDELCLDLNLDKNAKEEAWSSYQRIRAHYTLEGDQLHWLSCALYDACRRTVVPTVGRGTVEGNCVSLTRLLRSAKFSLIQFFSKMKKWADMANLPQEFRDKVDRLERNFAVSTVIFKKFEPIFLDIFRNPADDQPRQPRSRKQRRLPCSVTDVFNFCWTMFVQVKGNFPAISDDLVNSYHLLLCNIDWFYANALLGGRKDLLNPNFSGLPENYGSREWKAPQEAPCIIQHLCQKHEGLEIEAKTIKEHWWKPYIKKLFDKKTLKGKQETLSAVLEVGNFEANSIAIKKEIEELPLRYYGSKAINNNYEEYVLSVGDFDERIFLGEDAEEEIGTPAKMQVDVSGELSERMQVLNDNLQQHFEQTRSLAPSTPLTGRRYLKGEKDLTITPVSTATQSVSKLQHLLSGRKTCPSDSLLDFFSEYGKSSRDLITQRVKDLGETFCKHYMQPSEDHPGSQLDFAKKRLQLGECLYFKTLESILLGEKKRAGGNKDHRASLTALVDHEIFHRSLFACCLEIVIFSYNSQRTFPWIVEIFDLSPYHFYKVIEIIVREEEGLSRDVVKHLNHIEESILENYAWRNESPLWDSIREAGNSVPMCEEVALPSHMDQGAVSITGSPIRHPAVKRLAGEGKPATAKKDTLLSPPGQSVTDRFSSPSPGSAKRRLFGSVPAGSTNDTASTQTSPQKAVTQAPATQIIAFQQALMEDGRQVLIPVHTTMLPSTPAVPKTAAVQAQSQSSQQTRPKKTGSLPLFFRKLYHLANVRLQDLCDRLDVEEDQRRKMWTCLEHTFTHEIDLLMDRHLDQMIMCAIYVIAKVTGKPQSFQHIMKCYRLQPQAQSHVYRSVLLTGRRRHTSGSSDGSRNGASGSSSPVNVDNKEETKKNIPIRSSSTLPVPHPSSHPPTPTRLTSSGSNFDFGEERGDLIMFYNSVYIKRMKEFALKFSATHQNGDVPPLSPLPVVRSQQTSPRRVSNNHSVYISPHKLPSQKAVSPGGRNGLQYCFNRSPAKNLRAINNMIRMRDMKQYTGKRLLEVDKEEEGPYPPKRFMTQRLLNVTTDRQEGGGFLIAQPQPAVEQEQPTSRILVLK